MRDELMAGQYLDVLEGALATTSVERSLRVARFKSGKYWTDRLFEDWPVVPDCRETPFFLFEASCIDKRLLVTPSLRVDLLGPLSVS